MSIETANYISQFNPAIPADTDPALELGPVCRQLKTVLQTQFPNLGAAPVTVTATQINTGVCPMGVIVAFCPGLPLPAGWAICNGSTVARSDGLGSITTPNLLDRFIVGAGNFYSPGNTGGATSSTPAITVNGTQLTVSNLPSAPMVTLHDGGHAHGVNDPSHTHPTGFVAGVNQAGFNNSSPTGSLATTTNTGAAYTGISIQGAFSNISVTSNGADAAHAHTASSSAVATVPPYYALVYIMKI